MTLFNVHYQIVTQESAEYGEAEETGTIVTEVSLRDAIQALFDTRTNKAGGVNGTEYGDRWITVYNGMEFETGAYENRSLPSGRPRYSI